MVVLESSVEKRYCRMVRQWGGRTVKILMKDWPDRLVILPNGRMFFCELKRPGEKPRASQVHVHEYLRAMNVEVFVFDGSDWKHALEHLHSQLMIGEDA